MNMPNKAKPAYKWIVIDDYKELYGFKKFRGPERGPVRKPTRFPIEAILAVLKQKNNVRVYEVIMEEGVASDRVLLTLDNYDKSWYEIAGVPVPVLTGKVKEKPVTSAAPEVPVEQPEPIVEPEVPVVASIEDSAVPLSTGEENQEPVAPVFEPDSDEVSADEEVAETTTSCGDTVLAVEEVEELQEKVKEEVAQGKDKKHSFPRK